MKDILNKLKAFVQKAMNLKGTTAIFQIGNDPKAKRAILREKWLIEKLGGKVEWYYLDEEIEFKDLIWELEVMEPHVNRMILYRHKKIKKDDIIWRILKWH